MNESGWLILYSGLVLVASLLGGSVPLFGRVTHNRLQFYLSISAGVMLGASFFHVMPEAMEYSGVYFGWWMSLGVVGLFCIERFIAPHSHEVDGGGHHHHHEKSGWHEHEHTHEHGHEKVDVPNGHKDHRAAAPAVAGWMAVLGLTIHTFMNGVGLAGAVHAETGPEATSKPLEILGLALPGLVMFAAIVLHKPADALAISTVLSRKRVSRGLISLVQFGFAAMVPIGAWTFVRAGEALEEHLRTQLTGAALAFSAGTFLFIALSDLLPEVQFHRHDRIWLFLALAAGVAVMGGIAILEDWNQGHNDANRPSAAQVKHEDNDAGHEEGHNHEHGAGHGHKH
jgi:zinc and cadmium transporter